MLKDDFNLTISNDDKLENYHLTSAATAYVKCVDRRQLHSERSQQNFQLLLSEFCEFFPFFLFAKFD